MSVMRLVMLGTGSPRPEVDRAGPGQAIIIGERVYLIDCGDGTFTRLLQADLSPARTTRLLFTHLHTDHTFGYGPFVLGGWNLGRRELHVYGPPGLRRLHSLLFDEAYRADMEYRRSLGRDLRGLDDIALHEIGPGVVLEEDGLRITAAPVVHNVPTLALRFDYAGRAIVLSGDTVPCGALVELARGADVLVQDCCLDPDTRDRYTRDPANRPVWERIVTEHCDPEQCGRIAAEAGVGTMILTHLMPFARAEPTLAEARRTFDGRILFGRDLLEVSV